MAQHFSIHRDNWLAFFAETTICTPPADWVASGTAVEYISCDFSNVKEALVVDPTIEARLSAVGNRKQIRGIRNCEASAVLKLHGTGATTATDATVTATYLSNILAHCFGAQHQTKTREIVSGTTTVLTVANTKTATIIPGCLIAVEDTTSPTAQNEGKLHFRRVIAVDDGPDTITISEELPFTPASGDVIHGTITAYVDETVLQDAARSGTLYTFNWFHKRTSSGTDHLWQLEGCVAAAGFANLARGQLPQIALKILAANFRHSGDDSLSNPAFTSASGSAQLSNGIDVTCSISDYADDTMNIVDVNATTFEPGISRVRVETTTEVLDRFEGMSTYSVGAIATKFTTTVLPYAASWYAGLADGDEFRINFYQPGPGSGPGKAWCIHIPRAQLTATPGRVDVNEVHGAALEFGAMVPADTTGGSNTELQKSIFLVGFA